MEKNQIEYESFLARHLSDCLQKTNNIDEAVAKISAEYKKVTGLAVDFSDSALVIALKEAGVDNNVDDVVLGIIKDQQTYLQHITAFVSSYFYQASFYTGLVLFVAFLMVLLFVTTVIPSFEVMFTSFGVELPESTQQVLNYSYLYGLFLLLAIGWPVAAYSMVFRNFRYALLNRAAFVTPKLKVPGVRIIESLLVSIQATLALQIILAANKNSDTASRLALIKKNDSGALNGQDIVHLNIAEKMGSLSNELTHILTVFENHVNKRLGVIRILLSVFVLLLLGLFVGFFVISIYMPIFQISSAI